MSEEITYRGYIIVIEIDDVESDMSPRECGGNLGKMVCFHKKYILGDQHDFEDPEEAYRAIQKEAAVCLPLYLYDHSGITISTTPFSCPWDSGQVGWIYATKADVRSFFVKKKVGRKVKERAEMLLREEVKEYDDYIRGDIFRFMVVTPSGEILDFCGGYYGYPEGYRLAIEEAKTIIDRDLRLLSAIAEESLI